MRLEDQEVKEVVCSETGKPMPKIPLWMANVQVKFVSEEAQRRHNVVNPSDLEADPSDITEETTTVDGIETVPYDVIVEEEELEED